jgi:hypothetical protein
MNLEIYQNQDGLYYNSFRLSNLSSRIEQHLAEYSLEAVSKPYDGHEP